MEQIKAFKSQAAKDAAIARTQRALELSQKLTEKYEELYRTEMEEARMLGEMLGLMIVAPINGD